MADAKNGDTVKVHYTGTLQDGTVFDSSREREPLEFKLGETGIIPGFQSIVEGMNPGETKTEKLAPEDAYGPHNEQMVVEVERDQLPQDLDPQVGQHLHLSRGDGQVIPVHITNVTDAKVTIDANHPLAGQDLTFEVELLEIV